MFIITLMFVFGGSAIYISKKNKFSQEEALTIFLCSLLLATILPITIEYVSPTIHTSTVHTVYKNKENATATITLDDNTITLDTQKTNQTKKSLNRIIKNRSSDHQKGQLTLSKNKTNSTRPFSQLVIKGDPDGTKISKIAYGNITDQTTLFGHIPDPLLKINEDVVIVTLVKDKTNNDNIKTKKALDTILDNP